MPPAENLKRVTINYTDGDVGIALHEITHEYKVTTGKIADYVRIFRHRCWVPLKPQ